MSFNVFKRDGYYIVVEENDKYPRGKMEYKFAEGVVTSLEEMKRKLNEKLEILPEELKDQLWRIMIYCDNKKMQSLEDIDRVYEELHNEHLMEQMRKNCIPGAMEGINWHWHRQAFFSAHGQAYNYKHPGIHDPWGPKPHRWRHRHELTGITTETSTSFPGPPPPPPSDWMTCHRL